MNNKVQTGKRIFGFLMAFLIVALETAVMTYVWVNYYNTELPKAYDFWVHVFIAAVYMVLLFAASAMYGGLKIGSYRMIELMFSESIATILTNIVFYAIVCLLAYHFPTPVPLILGTMLQGLLIAGWILGSTYIFRKLFPPLDVLLIYDGTQKDLFVEKVKTRRHQFSINESVRATGSDEEIQAAIDKHAAVMLWDVTTERRNKIFKYCYERSVETYVMPKIMDIILRGSQTLHFFDTPLLLTKSSPIEAEQLLIKRLFDIVFSLVLIVITSPLMLLTALAVKLYDGGPVFYKQIRCTRDDKQFHIVKFRSMIVGAEKDGRARLASQHDDRITPVGRLIRKIRIDELPQLFNVLSGSMSFVGPRPERPEIIEKYVESMPEFRYRTKVKAGLTGYAQIYGKYNTRPHDKLKLDLYYIENFSVWLDLRLIIQTVKILFKPESTEGVAAGNITPIEREEGHE
ncbi:MAG: sugar transferase [Lachnospiraceae bacterium]|nr:sugar transferase [Lachnospiraceae bacterium]